MEKSLKYTPMDKSKNDVAHDIALSQQLEIGTKT